MITSTTNGRQILRMRGGRIGAAHALFILSLVGCVAEPASPPDAETDHPANPKAKASAYSPPANVLKPSGPDSAPPPTPSDGPKLELPAVHEMSPELRKPLEEMLKAYEEIRAGLAADKGDSISKPAKALSGAADQATTKAPDVWKDTLKKIASLSKSLGPPQPLELEAARKIFGDVSRQIIRIVSSAPALSKERKIFHCPMWNKGYAKWIQVDATLSNPYMGREMLECGSPSEWKE